MSIGLLFWILMVLWLVLGVFNWPGRAADARFAMGGSLLEFILLFLLGWRIFGFIVQS